MLDNATATRLCELITSDYREMPDLCLTKGQIQQLWRLDAATCGVIVDALERAQVLRRIRSGAYVLGHLV